MRHVDHFFVRLSQRLLEIGCRLHYGGSLNTAGNTLTRAFIASARSWARLAEQKDEAREVTTHDLLHPPLVSYAAWPYHSSIDLRQRAELVGICHFEDVDPEGLALDPKTHGPESPERARVAADALTAMRRLSTQKTHLRIVVAGKRQGWSGWLPGILEEIVCSLEANKLPIVLGGFGGVSSDIALFLKEPSGALPEVLRLSSAKLSEGFRRLLLSYGAENIARRRFLEAEAALIRFREQLHSPSEWTFDYPREDVLELLQVVGPADAIERIARLLSDRDGGGAPERNPDKG